MLFVEIYDAVQANFATIAGHSHTGGCADRSF